MAGLMVIYGPPITHLPPPAVGASPNAAIHDFKGSCRRSVRITVGRSLPCTPALEHLSCLQLSALNSLHILHTDYTLPQGPTSLQPPTKRL